jgi:hypothetical protein
MATAYPHDTPVVREIGNIHVGSCLKMIAQTAGRTPVDFASRPLRKSLTFLPGWRLGQAGTMTTTISLRLAVLGVALAFIAAIIFGAF